MSIKGLDSSLSGCSATGAQFGVLKNISEDGTTTLSELVRRVKCVASNMTSIIKRMEKEGLVLTVKNLQDKRETLVLLTDKGNRTRTEMEVLYQNFLKKNYQILSLEEQYILNLLLTKLEDSLTKH